MVFYIEKASWHTRTIYISYKYTYRNRCLNSVWAESDIYNSEECEAYVKSILLSEVNLDLQFSKNINH